MRIVLFLAAIIGSITTMGQPYVPYYQFVKEGKVWMCEESGRTTEKIGDVTAEYYQTTRYNISINGDTIVDTKTYKKVYKEIVSIDNELLYTSPKDAEQGMEKKTHQDIGNTTLYPELLREADNKVYALRNDTKKEYVLYDFSAKEKEDIDKDFPLGNVYVEGIDTVSVCGQYYRCFNINSKSDGGYNRLWVEGVGDSGGPFYSTHEPLNNGMTNTLIECYEDGQCIFTANDFNDVLEVKNVKISPSSSNKLYNLQGRRLNSKPTKGLYIEKGKVCLK